MNYIEADDAFFSILQDGGTDLFATIKTTAFPETYRAMFGFCAKTNSLKTAMFDMIESDNPYAFKALFRCYCEHYLKFTYLFVRFLKEKSDAVGVEYFSFCGAIEARDYVAAISIAEGLLGHSATADVEKVIAALYPRAAGVSERQLEASSGNFKYRAILRFLGREAPELIAKDQPFLASIVPKYAVLSSFVHGGPSTDADMQSYAHPEALQACENDAGLVFLMTASVLMFTALAVSREFPAQGDFAARVGAVMDRFRS